MDIILFDFEVFKYDCLFGSKILSGEGDRIYQTWDLDEIRQFYEVHQNDIWVGHNNQFYDNAILEAILKGQNPKTANDNIIKRNIRCRSKVPKYSYDLMAQAPKMFSLKTSELIIGKNISETKVDFDLDRPLTLKEKLETESYNRDDLEQTFYNFQKFYPQFKLRLEIINQFGLSLNDLSCTGTKLAAKVLKAKQIEGIENWYVPPVVYDTLQIENKDALDFYLNEKFRKKEKAQIKVGDYDITIGAGGIHSAIKKYYTPRALYFDVSGYYNLVMLNYDLLPRTLGEEGAQKYKTMYQDQLKLKKIDPVKRNVYKVILLAVFGAMMNEYCDFYDPQRGSLVTITGQLFIIDLLEKLIDKIILIQSNTDGIVVEPKDWSQKDEIIRIVEEWERRTGFTIKKEEITDLYQRDVNCYFHRKDGKIIFKGEAVKNFEIGDAAYAQCDLFDCKEPPVIAKGIVETLLEEEMPETVVEKYKDQMVYFQYQCKKNTYDYTTYDVTGVDGNVISERLQGVNRVFAWKDKSKIGMVYKHKDTPKGHSKAKVANLPESVFVYDNEILSDESVKEIQEKIDYQYYIDRIYERIGEFINE